MKTRWIYPSCLALALLAGCQKGSNRAASSPGSGQDLKGQGTQALLKGQYDQAEKVFQDALKQDPSSAELQNLLGMTYRFQHNLSKSLEWREKEVQAFRKAVELNPKSTTFRINLGSTLWLANDKKGAAEQFKQVLVLLPHHAQAEDLKQRIAEAEAPQTAPSPPAHKSAATDKASGAKQPAASP